MPGELEAPTAARGACACQTVTRKRMCEQRGVGPARAQGAGMRVGGLLPGDAQPQACGLGLRGASLKGAPEGR